MKRPIALLLASLFLLLSAIRPDGAVLGEEEAGPQIQKDGEFEIPRACKGISLINRADDYERMMSGEILPRVGELAATTDPEALQKKVQALAEEYGESAIECLTRIREPFMVPLFAILIDHEEWAVRRLAVFGLERTAGIEQIDKVVDRLGDDNFLVREIAAMTVAIFHNLAYHAKDFPLLVTRSGKKALKALKKRKKDDLEALTEAMEKEVNPYVRCAMEASIRALGKFRLLKVCKEYVTEDPRTGVRYIPRGGRQSSSGKSKSGGSSRMKPSESWCYPVAVYPKEILGAVKSDPPLVPLTAKDNSLHFGHDCAWMMAGCGVYAIGDGQLRTVELAGDFGVLIVGEYKVSPKEYVTALNGHCSMWAFAEPGPVTCRQLLGTVGLDFSVENGIHHAAHDHFGMFSGKYDRTRCYGRSGAGRSIEGWLIPAEFLGPKVVGREIDPDSY